MRQTTKYKVCSGQTPGTEMTRDDGDGDAEGDGGDGDGDDGDRDGDNGAGDGEGIQGGRGRKEGLKNGGGNKERTGEHFLIVGTVGKMLMGSVDGCVTSLLIS